ncbi:MAG TPA: sigma-70 family RNA polymerase sigma factor [Herpetosiphonaceae bacterium]|nr:sigma-70 family RNA polymerase sigma factor [Herpetosiphonaceae bacterium]
MSLSTILNHTLWGGRPYVAKEAFASLYHHSYPQVFRYVYALRGGPVVEVEDIVATTFLRAWTHRGSFDGTLDGAVGWLITIARRLVIDQQRRNKRLPAVIGMAGIDIAAPHELDAVLQRKENTALVTALLQRLDDSDRELLVLRYILGWTVRRIADHQQKSENAVSVAVRRARDRARDHLTTLMGGHP